MTIFFSKHVRLMPLVNDSDLFTYPNETVLFQDGVNYGRNERNSVNTCNYFN